MLPQTWDRPLQNSSCHTDKRLILRCQVPGDARPRPPGLLPTVLECPFSEPSVAARAVHAEGLSDRARDQVLQQAHIIAAATQLAPTNLQTTLLTCSVQRAVAPELLPLSKMIKVFTNARAFGKKVS